MSYADRVIEELPVRDFAAIDFETANYQRSSVCSVGLVVVRNGVIAERFYRLIRPTPNYYQRNNTAIHGLTRSDTDPAPHFPDVWRELAPWVEGVLLVAHNAPFDRGCLEAAHRAYEMPYPSYPFLCTLQWSRRHFPLLPNHRLSTVAEHIGYSFHHHHALEDAEACARLLLL